VSFCFQNETFGVSLCDKNLSSDFV
jgi:hypothetical protein